MRRTKWLQFHKHTRHEGRRTDVWGVCGPDRIIVGEVRWYGKWRKYTFFPWDSTVFDRNCLSEIVEFIDQCMAERKADGAGG